MATQAITNTIPTQCRPIIRGILGNNIQIFSATAAKIYIAKPDPKKWTDYDLVGALVFLKDNNYNGALFLRLVDIDKNSIIWEHEIYTEMIFQEEMSNFYTFASDDCMMAIHFVDENEAIEFFEIIKKKRQLYHAPIQPDIKADAVITKDLIGAPQQFRHVSHIGFNPGSGFDMKNVPKEWQEIIELAGVTPEQLENEETRQFILDFVRDTLDEPKEAVPSEPIQIEPEPPKVPIKEDSPPPPPRKIQPKEEEPISAPPPPPPPPLPNPEKLKSPQLDIKISKTPPPPIRPPIVDDRDKLLNSIRSAGKSMLKPVEQRQLPSAPTSPAGDAASSDLMANLLAKALADRSKLLQGEDNENSDDDAW